MDFIALLFTVLLSVLFIIPGFILGKANKVNESHLSSMSAVLVYGCTPCMIIPAFMNIEFTWKNFGLMGLFFIVTLVLQALFMLILYLALKKKYDDPKMRVFTIASTLGNTGYFGLPLITSLLPEESIVAAYSCIFVITMNILVFTVGVFCLTNEKKYMTIKKAVINPSFLSMIVAIPLFIIGVKEYIPEILFNGAVLLGKMSTPLCMIILGVRLSKMTFKKLFLNKFPYFVSLFKLLIFPIFSFFAVYFLPFNDAFKASILILSATPCAAVILNMAEMYNGEKELAADSVLVTTLLCVGTIPLLSLLLNIL